MYKTDTFPKNTESLKIVTAQTACAWLIFVVMLFLSKMFRTPFNPEISLAGLFLGSVLYGLYQEKKQPFSLSERDHSLTMRVMLIQTGVTILLLWIYGTTKGWVTLPMETMHRERLFVLTGIALGGMAPLSYLLTRIGLRTAMRRRMQARVSGT
jgi:hypothetical protein